MDSRWLKSFNIKPGAQGRYIFDNAKVVKGDAALPWPVAIQIDRKVQVIGRKEEIYEAEV